MRNPEYPRHAPAGPGFEHGEEVLPFVQENIRVLVVGAGGLGCELLKDLALSGFCSIDVIDMDTIDLSNLNRQFLFRKSDVGQYKATVAAARVMERVDGVTVTPHVGRIEDKDNSWYQDFHIIVLGLDSLEARRYMNAVVAGFLEVSGGRGRPPPPTPLALPPFRAPSAPRPDTSPPPPLPAPRSSTGTGTRTWRRSSPSSTGAARGSRATPA